MKKFLKNIVKLKKISTIKDFRFGTFPSISGSGSGYTFYRRPHRVVCDIFRKHKYKLPSSNQVYYRICTLRHIRIEINHGSQNV
jgi:hypothetical protein